MNITNYIELHLSDIKYFASLVGIVCLLAYMINKKFGSNLMFISQNFPGMPIEIIYNLTGKLYTLVMSVAQMTLPFYIVYFANKTIYNSVRKKRGIENEKNIYSNTNV